MTSANERPRRVPWVGIAVAIAIILLIVAFGVFKRKGSRKPPPIPETDTVSSTDTNLGG